MIFALGAFDGFHIGHQQLLDVSQRRAEKTGTGWGVITFEGHPQMLFNKDVFKLLFTPEERDMLISYFGIPVIEKIPFTRMLADMTPENFLDFIADRAKIHGLVTGENFRFGRARMGTPEKLSVLCKERGWSLDIVKSYMLDGTVVSSTAIRDAVVRGQMELACSMLGHPFLIQGRVIKGDGRGRSLGYPTANIAVKANKVYPERGAYAALAFIEGEWRCTALNIGYNPTFEGIRGLRCEAHIIDYDGNLYDKNITVFIISRNREEMKFAGPGELVLQLKNDVMLSRSAAASYRDRFAGMLARFERFML